MAKKILIVEDEATLNKALTEFLTSEGFEALSALDGEIGLEMAKKDNPDLILLDIILPKKDGYEVLDEIKVALRLRILVVQSFKPLQLQIRILRRVAHIVFPRLFAQLILRDALLNILARCWRQCPGIAL